MMGDATITTALLDRLTHHRHIVETGKECYRFRRNSACAQSHVKVREQRKRGKVNENEPFSRGGCCMTSS